MSDSARIVDLYERHADRWARDRGERLIETRWLDQFLTAMPANARVLDIGCGSGKPIARYLIDKGCRMTGIDSSPRMIGMCQASFPDQSWLICDMRSVSLDVSFDGILAWDSFFHLTCDDKRRMFPVFKRHAAPRTALMFTSGPEHGEAIGDYAGEPLYHASLASAEYRNLLAMNGFAVIAHKAEDPDCDGHTIWLARRHDDGDKDDSFGR